MTEARAHGQTDRLSRTSYEKPRGREASAARKENAKEWKERKEATREKGAKRGQQAAARPDRRVRAHKTNNKIWNTGRRPHVPVIFQGRQEDLPTYEETRGRSRSRGRRMAIGPGGEIFRIARSSLANVTVAGGSGDAPGHTLGVPSLIRWGSL